MTHNTKQEEKCCEHCYMRNAGIAVCGDKRCRCHTKQEEVEDWEKEFDSHYAEEFINYDESRNYTGIERVKDFIRRATRTTRLRALEEAVAQSYGIRNATDADEFRQMLVRLIEAEKGDV